MKVNEYQKRPQPLRHGEIMGFRYCVPGYLKMINDDLELGCSEADLAHIQNVYRRLNRDPWVSDLYFASSGLKSSTRCSGAVRISGLYSEDTSVTELFSSLVSRFDAGSPLADGSAPSLSALAEFAATQSVSDREVSVPVSISIGTAMDPVSPLPSLSPTDLIEGGGFYLSVSSGPRSAGELHDCGAMLYPLYGQDEAEFLNLSHEVCRLFALGGSRYGFMPLSGDGLIRDVAKVCDSARVDCRGLPERPFFPDAVFGGYTPSVIVFCDRSDLDRLSALSAGHGIGFCVPVQITNTKYFSVISGEGETIVPRSLLKDLTSVYPVTVKVGGFSGHSGYSVDLTDHTAGSKKDPERELTLVNSQYRVKAEVIGGERIYEELDRALSPVCDDQFFAVAGTLSPADPGTVPLILALDAACRNKKRNVAASAFFGGASSSVTVFTFTPTKK